MEKKRRTQGWVLLATQIDRFIENFVFFFIFFFAASIVFLLSEFHSRKWIFIRIFFLGLPFLFFLEDINLFTKMSRLNEYLIKPKEKSEMIRGAELD